MIIDKKKKKKKWTFLVWSSNGWVEIGGQINKRQRPSEFLIGVHFGTFEFGWVSYSITIHQSCAKLHHYCIFY